MSSVKETILIQKGFEDICKEVKQERMRQLGLWGSEVNQHYGLSDTEYNRLKFLVLSEEVGEVAKELLEGCQGLRAELIQVAAVAMAWLELID